MPSSRGLSLIWPRPSTRSPDRATGPSDAAGDRKSCAGAGCKPIIVLSAAKRQVGGITPAHTHRHRSINTIAAKADFKLLLNEREMKRYKFNLDGLDIPT